MIQAIYTEEGGNLYSALTHVKDLFKLLQLDFFPSTFQIFNHVLERVSVHPLPRK
jgi:hypothetical protein